jgi:hypothetical protein
MSLFDAEISKTIWNGKIPIKVSLDPGETDVYGNDKVWDPIHVKSNETKLKKVSIKKKTDSLRTLLVRSIEMLIPSFSYKRY